MMKILVTINPGSSPELYTAIETTPARDRAERLRTLATLGVVSARNGLQTVSAMPDTPPNRLEANQTLVKLKSSLNAEQ